MRQRKPLPAPLPALLLPQLGCSRLHAIAEDGTIATIESRHAEERSIVEVLGADGALHSHSGQPARVLRGPLGERREWYQHGRLSRSDGPAVVHPDGAGEWWWEGIPLSDPQTGVVHPLLIQPVSGATVTIFRLSIFISAAPPLTAWGKQVDRSGDHPGEIFIYDLNTRQTVPLSEVSVPIAEVGQPSTEFELTDQQMIEQPDELPVQDSPLTLPGLAALARLAPDLDDPEPAQAISQEAAARRSRQHRPQRRYQQDD